MSTPFRNPFPAQTFSHLPRSKAKEQIRFAAKVVENGGSLPRLPSGIGPGGHRVGAKPTRRRQRPPPTPAPRGPCKRAFGAVVCPHATSLYQISISMASTTAPSGAVLWRSGRQRDRKRDAPMPWLNRRTARCCFPPPTSCDHRAVAIRNFRGEPNFAFARLVDSAQLL
jgi:hypothetical protein